MKHDNVGSGSESLPDSLVYVVDDDESIRGALTSLLMSVGIHVRAFESADDFLAAEMPDVRVVSFLTFGCEARAA
jgi:FixJ family two-component response regulator